jgi:hypothetical protein
MVDPPSLSMLAKPCHIKFFDQSVFGRQRRASGTAIPLHGHRPKASVHQLGSEGLVTKQNMSLCLDVRM